MPGRPARKAPTSAPGSMSGARLVSRAALWASCGPDRPRSTCPRVAVHQSHVQREHVARLEEASLLSAATWPSSACPRERGLACPDQHVHAECLPVACDHAADPAVSVDSQRLVAQGAANADLPPARRSATSDAESDAPRQVSAPRSTLRPHRTACRDAGRRDDDARRVHA